MVQVELRYSVESKRLNIKTKEGDTAFFDGLHCGHCLEVLVDGA